MSVPITTQVGRQHEQWRFNVPAETFADADIAAGDVLTFSATLAGGTALPSWLSFDPATRTFTGTPGNGEVGTLSLKVMASITFH